MFYASIVPGINDEPKNEMNRGGAHRRNNNNTNRNNNDNNISSNANSNNNSRSLGNNVIALRCRE